MVDSTCPICGDTYREKVVVTKTSEFDNEYPGAFFDLMVKYQRRCSSRHDVETNSVVEDHEIVCYFHEI